MNVGYESGKFSGCRDFKGKGTAMLSAFPDMISTNPDHIRENFEISTLAEEALQKINEGIKTRYRFNVVVETGVPGYIPR